MSFVFQTQSRALLLCTKSLVGLDFLVLSIIILIRFRGLLCTSLRSVLPVGTADVRVLIRHLVVVVSIFALLTTLQSSLISTLIGAVLGIIAACLLPLA
jgi:hypothetical protein